MLQDLLDLARADSGFLQVSLRPLVLNELMAEVAEMAANLHPRQVVIDAPSIVTAQADRDRLRQVLVNLIDNAIKYSDTSQPVNLKLYQTNDQAFIQICDLGSGIPLADQARIFERFYRVDETRTRATGGHGLGLAIVKTFIEAMGGKISVRSTLGQGSTFTIMLVNAME
jgi:signal transduction histidine kinase